MKKEKFSLGIIYRTPNIKVIRDLEDISVLVFDLDKTLIDLSFNDPSLDEGVTWEAIEKAAGLHNNSEFNELLKQHIELAKSKHQDEERKKLAKKKDYFYKGFTEKQVSKGLYPIPYLPNVKYFFNMIQKSRKKYFLAILSSAPMFYVRKVGKDLGVDYTEGCKLFVDSKGYFTGKTKSNGLYGKKISLENLCEKENLDINEVLYHGDHRYDIDALESARLACAVKPFNREVKETADFILPDGDYVYHPILKILKFKNKSNFPNKSNV